MKALLNRKGEKHKCYTIDNLRLDPQKAIDGKTWLLLPDGFRDAASGKHYLMPTQLGELRIIASIPIKMAKKDSGTAYIRRCETEWKRRQSRRTSAVLDTEHKQDQIAQTHKKLEQFINNAKSEVKNAVDEVREEAQRASASMTDLFSLGRRGIKEQMEAYLADVELHGEKINHAGFRQAFQMAAQVVKSLGLPDVEKKNAREAILEQAAEAIRGTQEAASLSASISPALPDDDEPVH